MKYVRQGQSRSKNLTVFPLLIFLLAPLAAGLYTLARWAPDGLLAAVQCPLRAATGLPCPSCGSTLAVTRYADGSWWQGVLANPLLALLLLLYMMALVWTITVTIAPRWHGELRLSPPEKKAANWLVAFLIILNWIWLVNRY